MNYTKWLIAFFINIIIALVLLYFYPSTNELGAGFTVAILFILVRNASLYCGAGLLLLRALWLTNLSSRLLFLVFTLLNLLTALTGTILYFTQQANREWLHNCLLNGLLGSAMLIFTLWPRPIK